MLKELFNVRILINCLIFSLIIGGILLWRITYVRGMEMFSAESGEVYLYLVGISFVVLRVVMFVLYLFARREENHRP